MRYQQAASQNPGNMSLSTLASIAQGQGGANASNLSGNTRSLVYVF